LVSDDNDEYDEGVHITMPEDDAKRASAALVLTAALLIITLGSRGG